MLRVRGVELDERRPLDGAVLGQVRVAGVEEPGVVLRRQQLQRVAGVQIGVAVRSFAWGDERRQDRLPEAAERLADQLDLARRRGEHARAPRAAVVGVGHAHPADGAQLGEVDLLAEGLRQQRLVVVEQGGFVEAHGAGQPAEQLGVAARLATRGDRRLVPAHPQVTPRRDHVGGLELGGGRQHDVGVARRVGEELLVDHREQVVAGETPADQFGVGHGDQRVGVPHDHRRHRRVERGVGERLAEAAHVELPRHRPAQQIGPGQGGLVDERVVVRADAAREPAAAVVPGTDEGREDGERAVEHRPVLVVLGADQGADGRRSDRAVVGGEPLDHRRVETADRRGSLGRPVRDVGGELGEADGVGLDPRRVDEPVTDQHVHHRQHQGDVGPGQRLHELVSRLGRDRADRIDDDDLGAVGPGGLDRRPQVAVGQAGVRAPQQDQPAVAQLERVEAEPVAVRHAHPVAHRRAADRPQQPARPEVVEEPAVETHHRQQALVAGVAERHDRLGTMAGDHVVEPRPDLGEGVVPGDRREPTLALGPDPAQRVQQALRAVDAIEEAVDLGAQLALAERVVGPPAQLDGDTGLDRDRPTAGVRAVVVARAVDDAWRFEHAGHATRPARRPHGHRVVRSGTVTTTASNWAGNQRWLVAERAAPRSTEEVAAIVRHADGRRVKAIGAGHSFTAAATTDGVQVSLDAMSRLLDVDADRGRVRVEAGIRLSALNDELAGVGLAMPNLGDIDRQSIAGAIATATHGTGLGLGNLATTVVAMEIVTGTGDVVRLDEHSDPELLRVARVGLGALGIVTEVTLQCVPAFNLHATETIEVLDDDPRRVRRAGGGGRPLRAVLDAWRRQALPGQAQHAHRRAGTTAAPTRLRARQVAR